MVALENVSASGPESSVASFVFTDGTASSAPRDVLAFELAEWRFGLAATAVHRIERPRPPTRVPRGPVWLEGVTVVLGEIVPVVNLHAALGITCSRPPDDRARLILVEHEAEIVGALVDAVIGLITVTPATQTGDNGLVWRKGLRCLDQAGAEIIVLDFADALW
ncbi:MAG: chemotaxis protein CheW [Chloroflexi bacterium]|nr:chemotaxis protein CheW [Chloroflexota bacterium]